MTNQQDDDVLIERIKDTLQKIQDKTIPRPELGNFDMRDHDLYWKLGILVKEYVSLKKIPEDHIVNFILKNLKDFERKIRENGKREGKEPFPTWLTEDKREKKLKPPKTLWVLRSWEFVEEYQDEERWNLVANLSGHQFRDENNQTLFTRKFAEDLLTRFSKKIPPPNAEELQNIFIKEISKFDHKPSRKSEWEPLIKQIFGKAQIDINQIKDNFNALTVEVNDAIDEKNGSEVRSKLFKEIGEKELSYFRSLLQIIRINDEKRFAQKLKNLDIPGKISTKHQEVKYLYQNLYPLLKDVELRSKILKRITSFQFSSLNAKLKAITSDIDYNEYIENEKLSDEFFK